jgi:hypothetical protein
LPEADLACYIAYLHEGREVKIEARSLRGEEMLKKLFITKT